MFLPRQCVPVCLRLFKPTLSLHQFRDKERFIQRQEQGVELVCVAGLVCEGMPVCVCLRACLDMCLGNTD